MSTAFAFAFAPGNREAIPVANFPEVQSMKLKAKMLLGLGLLAVAPFGFAQTYNMDLTGVGNGVVADGVYVSPYQGTVTGNGLNYTGYLICDDFNTESYLRSPSGTFSMGSPPTRWVVRRRSNNRPSRRPPAAMWPATSACSRRIR
jgi:hypothetical protein